MRIVLVQPICSVDVDEQPNVTAPAPEACCKTVRPVGETVGANGAILTLLGNLLQKAATELPVILPEIVQLIALFGGKVDSTPANS